MTDTTHNSADLRELAELRTEISRLRGLIARSTRSRFDDDYFIPAEDIASCLEILREVLAADILPVKG